jgi:hypothetical protein
VATHFKVPEFPTCPNVEIPNRSNNFGLTDSIFLAVYFKNLFTDDDVDFTVFRPDNSIWDAWTWTDPWPFYTSAYVYYWMIAGSSEQVGTWKLRINYLGIPYDHFFNIGIVGTSDLITEASVKVFPNPAQSNVHIELPTQGDGLLEIEVRNMLGQTTLRICEVYAGNFSKDLDLSGLENGIYHIIANDGTHKFTTKITLIH